MKFKNLHIILFFLLSLFSQDLFGIKETFTSSTKIGSTEIFSLSTHIIPDTKYSLMQSEGSTDGKTFGNKFYNHKITNRFTLRINKDDHKHQPYPYVVSVKLLLKIEWYNPSNGGFSEQILERVLKLNYDPNKLNANETVLEFNESSTSPLVHAGNKITLEITEANVSPNSASGFTNIELIPEIEVERYYHFIPSIAVNGFSNTPTNSPSVIATINNTKGVVHFAITNPGDFEAEKYDIEWVYVNNYDGNYYTGMLNNSASNVPFTSNSFNKNNSRITIKENSFDLPLIYDKGFIVYRVRAYGRSAYDHYLTELPGIWSINCNSSCNKLSDFNGAYIQIDNYSHNPGLNWQYSLEFAEDGKHKVSSNYFDGTLRGHQTVVKSNSLNSSIVSEKIYDYQGRPAITVLPHPTNDPIIKYYPSQTLASNGLPYTKSNFDNSGTSLCISTTDPIGNTSGSGKYYSSNRELTGDPTIDRIEAYLPDAEGYPISQTVFTPDNTGRVQFQTGLGLPFNLNGTSSKLTKYYYSKPFQEELYRFFGSEAGDASHYKKNMVVDPNGQVSVSYLDPAGKVIATSLSGVKPSSVSNLATNFNHLSPSERESFTVDLLNKKSTQEKGSENIFSSDGMSLNLNTSFVIPMESNLRYFTYGISNTSFTTSCTTPSSQTHCFNCVVDVSISLEDECGTTNYLNNFVNPTNTPRIVGQTQLTSLRNGTYNKSTCGSATDYFSNGTSSIGTPHYTTTLNSGTYYLNKKLKVNEEALDKYTNLYLADNSCLKTYNNFRDEQNYLLEVSSCSTSCATCISQLGAYSQYENPEPLSGIPKLSLEQYNNLLEQCSTNCITKSQKCESAFQTMLLDVSPQGQYGQIRKEAGVENGDLKIPEPSNSQNYAGGFDYSDINPRIFPLSVFNDGNLLPINASYYPTSIKPCWRYPLYNGNLGDPYYKDEKGNEDYIIITIENGKFKPSVSPRDLLHLIPISNGRFKIKPQYLANVSDFLSNWKPSWALSLIVYHPEFNLSKLCNYLQESHDFDALILKTTTYSEAVTLNLFNPLGASQDGSDPLFNGSTGKNSPYADINDFTHFRTFLDHMVDNGPLTPPTSQSIWQLAYTIVMAPNEDIICNANGSMPAIADFSNPFPGLNQIEQNAIWNVFKGLYLNLKGKYLDDKIARISIESPSGGSYGGYNGCIGKKGFDPTRFNFATQPIPSTTFLSLLSATFALPDVNSQFYNFEQPCNCQRYGYYKDKIARFPISDELISLGGSQMKLFYDEKEESYAVLETYEESSLIVKEAEAIAKNTVFQNCGKCPLAISLENYLDGISAKGRLLGTYSDIECENKEMSKNLFEGFGASFNDKLTWEASQAASLATDPFELTVNVKKAGTYGQLCTIKMILPNSSVINSTSKYSFSDILAMHQIKYVPTSDGSFAYGISGSTQANGRFYITARVLIKSDDPLYDASFPTQTKDILIKGVSNCLDLGSCSLPNMCESSDEAKELLGLFNTMAFTGQSLNSTSIGSLFKSSTDISLFNTTDDRIKYGVTSQMKYYIDKAISPNFKNLYEDWKWKATNVSNNNITVAISGTTTENIGTCSITFNLNTTQYPGRSLLNDEIVKFTHIAPDPDNLVNGFILTTLMKNVGATPNTFHYVNLKGSSPCFVFGNCSNDLPNQHEMAKNGSKQFCSEFAEKEDLLNYLNLKEGSWGGGDLAKLPYACRECEIFDQTGYQPGAYGNELARKLPKTNPNRSYSDFEDDLNNLVPSDSIIKTWGTCSPCPKPTPIKYIRLYGNYYKQLYTKADGSVDLIAGSGVDVVSGMYYSCLSQSEYIEKLDQFGNRTGEKYRHPYYVDLPISPCFYPDYLNPNPLSYPKYFNVRKSSSGDGCEIYYGYHVRGDCSTNVKIPLCGTMNGSGCGNWCVSRPNNPCTGGPGTCHLQIEFPFNSHSFDDILSVLDILPDPERPEQGYFKMLVKFTDETILEVKAYNSCLPKFNCKSCEGEELAMDGDLKHTGNINLITDYNSYTYNSTSTSTPFLDQGQYRLINKIPLLTGSTEPAEILDHTPSGNTSFLICKSHSPLSQDWSKQILNPELDNLPYIWGKKYLVQPNTNYTISFFYLNANKTAASTDNSILVRVNQKDILEKQVSFDASYQWKKVSFSWNSGKEEYLDLGIFNIETNTNNYIAFDDLSIQRVCGCSGGPLSRNFDFDQGNNSIGADANIINSQPGGSVGSLGSYYVSTNLGWIGSTTTNSDHTYNGKGKFAWYRLIDNSSGAPFSYKIWNQKIDILRNKDYEFSIWWKMPSEQNIQYGNHKAVINIKINNIIVQSIETGNNGDTWNILKTNWNSGENIWADIKIEVLIDRNIFTNAFEIALDDVWFKENCNSELCETKVPNLPVLARNLEAECVSYMNLIRDHNAKMAYESYINQVKKDFREAYIAKCLGVQESFLMKSENNEYHTTLYYYDQAGNLVRTVPPEGVDLLSESEINAVKQEIKTGDAETYNSHSYATTYQYNSLNQLISQSTPDQEDFNVWDGTKANLFPLTSTQSINSLTYVDKYRGVIVGNYVGSSNGFIKYGDPIKNNWTDNLAPIDYGDLLNLHVVSETEVYATNKEGAIIYTTDGGTNWYSKNAPIEEPIIYLRKLTSTMVILDGGGRYWKSTDNGTTWGETNSITSVPITIKSVSSHGNSFVALGSDGARYYCADVTQSTPIWIKHTGIKSEKLNKVGKYRNLNKWFASGSNGFMLSSNDEGNNWNWLPNNLSQNIKDAFIWNDSKAVFFTDNNKIFYTPPNANGFTNLVEYNNGITFTDMAISGDIIYLLDNQGNVYINNIYNSNVWPTSHTISAPSGGGDFHRITISNDFALFRTRVLSGNLEIHRSIGSGSTWATANIQIGTTISSKTLVDFTAFTETSIEVIVTDGSTKSLFEIKDINTTSNTSTITAISISTGEPKKYEKNHLTIPFLVTNNSGTLKLHGRSATNTWQAFDYPLPINNTNQSSVWMENSNLNAKGICVGLNGDIFNTIYKWKPSATNVSTTFDRSNKIKLPQLNAINTNGINVVAVGENGVIIYSTITSGNLSPNWNILQHNCDKNDLLDIKGNKDANMIAVGINSKPIRIKNVSSIVTASSITSLPNNLDGKNIKKLEIHNYTSGNSNMNLFLVDDLDGINAVSFNLSSNSYVSSTYTNTNSTPITNSLNGIGSYGTKLYLVGNKSVSSGQTHQILKIDYSSGALSGSGYGVSLNNVTSLNKVIAIKGTNSLVAVGKSGFLIKSDDKGLTWKSKYTGVSEDLISVSFSDANNGIAVGKNKTLIFTTNGGNKWQTQTMSGSNYDFVDVAMGAANRIIAIIKYQNPSPDTSGILVNVSGLSNSATWNNVNVSGTVPFINSYNAISFPGPKFAFIVGNNNKMLRLSYASSNYTATVLKNNSSQDWSYAIKSTNNNLYSVYFRDYENGFVGGDNGFLMRTRNGGGSSPTFEWSISYCGKKIALLNGCLNENLHLVQYGSIASDTVVCLKNAEYSSHFYYDGLGRMVASQNTKQMREGKTVYSYTLYDYKGRIIEVGKKYADNSIEDATATYNSIAGPVYTQGMVDYNRFATWIVNGGTTYPRKEVTKTIYDNSYYNVQVNNTTFTQDNLRGRVASSTYTDLVSSQDIDSEPSNDTYITASHYSYDIHGNVKSLVQENKILNGINPELVSKVLEYDYDLISGKVNKVIYQKGMPDQFLHKYGYDADNRIISVETSNDGVIWQKDAKYFYYRHGPLARIELGTQQVQGVDYAYTIQGWLKGVNSTNLKGENDIGKDAYNATTNYNANFGKDEFGFSLNYFDEDYTATKMPNGMENYFLGSTTGSGLVSSTNNLYNGNIKSMVTTLGQFTSSNYPVANGMVYGYDQLNRIISAQNNTNYDRDNNAWLSAGTSTAYKSDFTYDANGNIRTLQRRDESGTLYDNFTYYYDKVSSGNIKNTNRLTYVNDAIVSSPYIGDIENGQISTNYKYDALGNLISDTQEEIGNIEWTVYGKIKKITRSNGSSKPDLEFLYDPSGNRICKIVKPAGGSSNDWVYTMYYRDAQGNIMSTYESKFSISKQVNTYIYGSSRLGELTPDAFNNCGVNIELNEINDKEKLKSWFSNYIENVLGFSPEFSNAMVAYIENDIETDLGVEISAFVTTTNPQGENYKRFVKNLSSLFCRIRLFHGLTEESFNNQFKNKIKEWFTNGANASSNWNNFTESTWVDIENSRKQIGDETYADLLGNGAFVYDDATSVYALGSRKYELSNHLGNVLAVITDKKIPNGNNGNFEDIKILNSQFLLGKEDWDAVGASILTNTNDKLNVSGTVPNIGTKVSVNLINNTNYTLSFDLNYSSTASDIEIKVLDNANNVLYTATAYNQTGINTFSIPITIAGTNPRIEITNTANITSFEIDNVTMSVDGVLGVSSYSAQVISAQDYYPFGTTLPGRTYQNPRFLDYRFSFNGMEKLDEINGSRSVYDFGARIYDGRLGRWFSLDPMQAKYPSLNPYNFVANSPNLYYDGDGNRIYIYYKNSEGNTVAYVYGSKMKVPNDNFVLTTIATLEYLKKTGDNNLDIIDQMSKSETKRVTIVQSKENALKSAAIPEMRDKNGLPIIGQGINFDDVSINNGTIPFNPNAGLANANYTQFLSPGTILMHELGHMYNALFNTKLFLINSTTYNANFDDEEERDVIQNFERSSVRYAGEWVRNNHQEGVPITTDSPTSNKPILTSDDKITSDPILELK